MSIEEGAGSKLKPLLGTDEATVDDKGRILVSKKKRERLGETFAIALGPLGCLEAYPQDVWDEKVSRICAFDSLNPAVQQFGRLVLGTAEDELKFDAQGRVVVPQKLRELGKLKDKDKVLLIGCGDRLEIWSVSEWEQFQLYPDVYGLQRRQSIEKAYGQMVAK
jgi:MraZ protein